MKSPVALLVLLLIVFAPPPPAADALPLFDGLGSYSRTIATASPEAQRYSDQELAFMYAFDHDEAIRACTRAIEADRRYTARAADRARDRCRHPDQIAVPVSAGRPDVRPRSFVLACFIKIG